ncbi:unnamed protein product [Bursaphelenchus xylophilus]|uniref:(pine wood nematode) hypothetical protein n=1 Tax=Bursaphelenchus xylophilus TaxID=6326 RepID=A0A1I7SFA7_BURXY|nr:unnamed protein product [Bursaphelenchus xylophilus]CAG9130432.1 unnamed protein product [Bursaphelenchus xylophilus]
MYKKVVGSLLAAASLVSLVHCDETANPVVQKRNQFGVYSFVTPDYPAAFAIVAGISIILTIGIIFIVVGLLTMDPGRDSIIYRMTTTRMKKE